MDYLQICRNLATSVSNTDAVTPSERDELKYDLHQRVEYLSNDSRIDLSAKFDGLEDYPYYASLFEAYILLMKYFSIEARMFECLEFKLQALEGDPKRLNSRKHVTLARFSRALLSSADTESFSSKERAIQHEAKLSHRYFHRLDPKRRIGIVHAYLDLIGMTLESHHELLSVLCCDQYVSFFSEGIADQLRELQKSHEGTHHELRTIVSEVRSVTQTAIMRSKPNLIYFIHGLSGDPTTTWLTFPTLLRRDPALKSHYDCSFFEYHTTFIPTDVTKPIQWFRIVVSNKILTSKTFDLNLSITALAELLRSDLSTLLAKKGYESITFVCHSLGGLVLRKCLLDQALRDGHLLPKCRGTIFLAVPHNGSHLAEFARLLSDPLLKTLRIDAPFLEYLNHSWKEASPRLSRIRQFYFSAANDLIVPPDSARPSWAPMDRSGVSDTPVTGEDHWSIVKVARRSNPVYQKVSVILKDLLNSPGESHV